jgi:type IV secretion system protein VirD4
MSGPWAVFCRLQLVAAFSLAAYVVVTLSLHFPPLGCLFVAGTVWRYTRRRYHSGSAFGTARLASMFELFQHKMLGPDGLFLGRASYVEPPSRGEALRTLFSPGTPSENACRLVFAAFLGTRWRDKRPVRLARYTHLATFAPTGRGKGVSVLIPNLLSDRQSCVVTDPKGELFQLTAEHRRQRLGHRVLRLDPFAIGSAGPAATLNPMDLIDPRAVDFIDQCRDLANALVVRQGTEHEPHWNDSAELVLTAFIAFVAAYEPNPAERNLQLVKDLVSSRHAFGQAVAKMQTIEGFGGVIKRAGHQLSWFQDKELGSVLTTVQRHTAFLDGPAVAACTRVSSFDPRELRSGRVTLYLILPPERLVTLAPLMRTWISTLLRALSRGQASEQHPVLFYLDEAGHLGRNLQSLEDAVTLMRGYGIRLWFFFQSVAQLKDCFGDRAAKILDNIDTQQYFGTNAFESAEAISKRAGDATILIESINKTVSRSRPVGPSKEPQPGSVSTSWSVTSSETGRPLFRPDEVIRLAEDVAIVFHRNLPVIPVELVRYYDAPEFAHGGIGAPRELGFASGVAAFGVLLLSFILIAVAGQVQIAGTGPAAGGARPFPSVGGRMSSAYRGTGRPLPPGRRSPMYRPGTFRAFERGFR